MVDPIETFKLPLELAQVLSSAANRQVTDKVIDIDRRFFERDPETEVGRSEGRHLWELFDSIASKLKDNPNFLHLVEEIIPTAIDAIRIELRWYPHNFDADLRPYFLKAPIRKWRLRALGVSIPRANRSKAAASLPASSGKKRLRATIESPSAARRMENYIESAVKTQTQFAIMVNTTDRTLLSFRRTGRIRRDIFARIAEAMGITTEELLKPE